MPKCPIPDDPYILVAMTPQPPPTIMPVPMASAQHRAIKLGFFVSALSCVGSEAHRDGEEDRKAAANGVADAAMK